MTALSMKERIEAKRGTIAAGRAKGMRTYKFKAGKTTFRILPSTDGTDFERRFGVTYLKTFDGNSFFAIGDREITYGNVDPIREMIFDAMRETGDKEMKEFYYKLLAKPRMVFNAIILDDKDQEATIPVLIDMSESQFDNILAQFEAWVETDPDYDLTDLVKGHNFTCEKSGEKLDTKYVFLAKTTPTPVVGVDMSKLIDMDAWIKSQFEMKEVKAIEFLSRLNAAAGITTTVSAGLLTTSSGTPAATSVNTTAITTLLEEEDDAPAKIIVDAEISEVFEELSEEQLAQITADEEEAEVAAAIAAVKAARAAKTAKTAIAAAAALVTDSVTHVTPAAAAVVAGAAEIDDILAGLE